MTVNVSQTAAFAPRVAKAAISVPQVAAFTVYKLKPLINVAQLAAFVVHLKPEPRPPRRRIAFIP